MSIRVFSRRSPDAYSADRPVAIVRAVSNVTRPWVRSGPRVVTRPRGLWPRAAEELMRAPGSCGALSVEGRGHTSVSCRRNLVWTPREPNALSGSNGSPGPSRRSSPTGYVGAACRCGGRPSSRHGNRPTDSSTHRCEGPIASGTTRTPSQDLRRSRAKVRVGRMSAPETIGHLNHASENPRRNRLLQNHLGKARCFRMNPIIESLAHGPRMVIDGAAGRSNSL